MSTRLPMASYESAVRWAEMIKLSHSIFALPFALMAAFLAGRYRPSGLPAAGQLGLIVMCMVTARCVAMTFNRIADARIDACNPRTAGRAIPAGNVGVRQAWMFLALSAAGFVLGCVGFWVFFANYWPMLLALPVLLFLCAYSYCKWWTNYAHFYLGSAIALSPIAAWLAVDPDSLGPAVVLLAAAVALWIGGFDIIYACQDIEFDRRHKLHSLPAALGAGAALWVARAAHVGTVALLAAVGLHAGLGGLYWVGVAAVVVLLIVEHAVVRAHDLSKVNMAFFTFNGLVSLVMGLATVADILVRRDVAVAAGGAG